MRKGGDKVKATARRQEIFEMLCDERHITMDCLANRFNVTRRTIITDITELSLHYPVYTIAGRYGGGVYIANDFKLDKDYLTSEQEKVLNELFKVADFNQKDVLMSVLKKFGRRTY